MIATGTLSMFHKFKKKCFCKSKHDLQKRFLSQAIWQTIRKKIFFAHTKSAGNLHYVHQLNRMLFYQTSVFSSEQNCEYCFYKFSKFWLKCHCLKFLQGIFANLFLGNEVCEQLHYFALRQNMRRSLI